MNAWENAKEKLPSLNEEVMILYKDKNENDNLKYGLAERINSQGTEVWSNFISEQNNYEVVYWAHLLDKPRESLDEDNAQASRRPLNVFDADERKVRFVPNDEIGMKNHRDNNYLLEAGKEYTLVGASLDYTIVYLYEFDVPFNPIDFEEIA